MEKTIKIGGHEFAAKSTAASLLSYKRNFHRDALKDLLKLCDILPDKKDKDLSKNNKNADKEAAAKLADSNFEFEIFYRFLWVFAKAANPEIPPMEEWMENFDDVSPIEFAVEGLTQSMDLLMSSTETSVKPKNHPATAAKR